MKKPIVDIIIQEFIDRLQAQASKPIYTLSPEDARAVLDSAQKIPVDLAPVDIETKRIPVIKDEIIGDETVGMHIVRPKGNTQTLPAIIYMHGGGWVLGNFGTHERLIRELVNGTQAVVIFVDYTPAPDGQYPLIHEQGYAVAKWAAEQADALNIDPSHMIIAGDSVGGLEATAIAILAQERGGPYFAAQLLLYPVTDANFDTPSYNDFAQGPWLTKSSMEWFWDMYVPHKDDRKKHLCSPLRASLEQLKDLPPTIIVTNEYDVLRDEGEAYAHKLIEAGVPVVAIRLIGTIHDCLMLNAITNAPPIRAAITQICGLLKEIFSKD